MRSLLSVCALATLLTSLTAASSARADARLDVPRISGLYGLQLVVGPEVETNGLTEGHPVIFMPLPTPQLSLRLDVPLLLGLEVGVEARVFAWTTTVEESLGYGAHTVGDLSLVPAYALGRGRHRVRGALLIGPSFDYLGARDGSERVRSDTGYHLGAMVGYVHRGEHTPWGFTADAGIVYHRLTHRIDYRGAEPTADVIVYQPFDLFVRLGVVLHLGG